MPTILEAWLAEQTAERLPWQTPPLSDDAGLNHQPLHAVTGSGAVRPSTRSPTARVLRLRAFLFAALQAPRPEQASVASALKDAVNRCSWVRRHLTRLRLPASHRGRIDDRTPGDARRRRCDRLRCRAPRSSSMLARCVNWTRQARWLSGGLPR